MLSDVHTIRVQRNRKAIREGDDRGTVFNQDILHVYTLGGDGASEAGEMSEASEAGEASGVSETIEARRWRCRSDAWCKGGRCTAE